MFILPIGDAPNFAARRPWATWSLMTIGVVVHTLRIFLCDASGGESLRAWGHVPLDPTPLTWLTHMFVHGGWLHLALNVVGLWVFGDNVEGALGPLRFLIAYVVCGLAGALVFDLTHPHGAIPLVGASGAVFGVMAMYVGLFPKNRIRFILWFFAVVFLWAPVRLVVGGLVAIDVVMWIRMLVDDTARAAGGIAHAAHVGGAAVGLCLALLLRSLVAGSSPRAHPASRPARGVAVMLESAGHFERRGDAVMAERIYTALVRDHVGTPEASTAAYRLGLMLHALTDRRGEGDEYLRHARDYHPDESIRVRAEELLERPQ